MQDILIVGNITKDVYLRLDDHKNHFEKDQDDVDWLDFAFNGDTHEFFSRVAVFGGSAITKEVFTNFDINLAGGEVDGYTVVVVGVVGDP